MKTSKSRIYYINRFQEVICFLTAKAIKTKFNTIEEYKKAKSSSKAYNININWAILQKLSRIGNNTFFEELLNESKNLFIYHRHAHKHFKSGKHFSRNSWFELSDETLKLWFADEKNFNPKTCKLISKDTHKWIDRNIYANKHEEFEAIKSKSNIILDDEDVFKTISNIPDFQNYINQLYISKHEAEALSAMIGDYSTQFKAHKSGWSRDDRNNAKDKRREIFNSFIKDFGAIINDCDIKRIKGFMM